MIGSLPRASLIFYIRTYFTFDCSFSPNFGVPVQHMNGIESGLV